MKIKLTTRGRKEDDRFVDALIQCDLKTQDLFADQLHPMIRLRVVNTWRLYVQLLERFGTDPIKWADFVKVCGNLATARNKRLNMQASLLIRRVPPKDKFQGAFEEFTYGNGFYHCVDKSDVDAVRDMIQNA